MLISPPAKPTSTLPSIETYMENAKTLTLSVADASGVLMPDALLKSTSVVSTIESMKDALLQAKMKDENSNANVQAEIDKAIAFFTASCEFIKNALAQSTANVQPTPNVSITDMDKTLNTNLINQVNEQKSSGNSLFQTAPNPGPTNGVDTQTIPAVETTIPAAQPSSPAPVVIQQDNKPVQTPGEYIMITTKSNSEILNITEKLSKAALIEELSKAMRVFPLRSIVVIKGSIVEFVMTPTVISED